MSPEKLGDLEGRREDEERKMAGGRSSVIIPIIILLTFKPEGGGDDRREGAEGRKENVSSHEEKPKDAKHFRFSFNPNTTSPDAPKKSRNYCQNVR